MGSKGSQKTTQSYTPNASVGQTGTQALDMARHAAGQPFQIPAAPVANFTDDQLSAFADMRNDRRLAQPYMQNAAGLFQQSASPISAAQIGNYLNPFANYVMGGLQDIFGQQRTDATGRLTQAAGGAGADRIAVAQANLAKQQGLAAGQTLAGIYQPALAAAQADAQRQQSAAYGMGQLGTAAQNAALQGSQAVLGAGNQQQALEQQRLMSPYQQRLAELEYPFKTAQFLSGINAQQAQPLGGTQTNTYPGQSPWGTIAGLGLTAAGAFTGNPAMMGAGIKGTMGSQSGGMTSGGWNNTGGGWNPNVSGGYVYPGGGGGTGMAPWSGLGFGRGGAVNPYDFGRTFGAGGYVDLEDIGGSYQSGGDVSGIDWNNPQPPETPPEVAEALATGAPLPDSAALPPPPPPTIPQGEPALPPSMRSDLPPEITGNEGVPPTAMGYAPMGPQHSGAPSSAVAPPWLRNAASFPPRPPTAQPVQPDPYALPPDQGEGTFARSPGLALMNAGLATLAASGRRDSRGLPMSPWAAIGEGGMKGVETLKVQDQVGTQRRRVELEARRLLQQAEHQRATLAEQRRYHDIIDQNRKDQLAITRQNRLDALDPSRLSPAQQALIAATRRKGAPLDDNEVLDIIQRTQRPTAERSPGTPEQQAIAAKERALGRPLNETEIAQVVQTVRQGPPAAPTDTPASTILGDDDVAPNFEGATGLSGAYTNLHNKITGAFGAQHYPAEHKATRILNDLSVKTQSTLQNVAGRPSNYWLGRLETLTVKPNSWSEGPQAARDRLTQTRDTIDQEIKRVDALIQNPQTSKADRSKAVRSAGELRGLKADYDAVIRAWGGGAGNPLTPVGETIPAPSMGEVREGAQGAAKGRIPPRPANVPLGSKYSPSRKAWRTPDGQVIPHTQ